MPDSYPSKIRYFAVFAIFCIFLALPDHGFSINKSDTRLLSQPALSDNHIAFIYSDNLWIADIDGSNPKRLTINEGNDSNPAFSPDGRLLAFSSNYNGNIDVYTVPVTGGMPKRLTWHPSDNIVRGFTPDGKSILFKTIRSLHNTKYHQLYTVSIDGGYPEKLTIPHAFHASYSPDGRYMAYTPRQDYFYQWKNYRGGAVSEVWIFSFDDHSLDIIPKPEGGCNDTNPLWIEDHIYFLSDRDGEFNLFSYNIDTEEIKKHTNYNDFPIISISNNNETIIFEQAGYLHTFNTVTEQIEKLTIGIATELSELRPYYISGSMHIRSADISPNGIRAVFGYRGEIITVPAEHGDPRNITRTPQAHEIFPAWSPDGKFIAYFTDKSGENQLAIIPQDGKGEARTFELNGSGFYAYPKWSPDSSKIAYVDSGRSLYIININNGDIKKVSSDEMFIYGPYRDISGSWSSDSKWLAYTRILDTNFSKVYIYSIAEDKSYPVTDGLSHVTEPVFDPEGKYLFFFASIDAGPRVNWFDLSNSKISQTQNIYLATLQKDLKSPFIRKSDEELTQETQAENNKTFKIDLKGIQNRIIACPVSPGNYSNLDITSDGQLLYIDMGPDFFSQRTLKSFNLNTQSESELGKLNHYILSANRSKILYTINNQWFITDIGPNIQASAKHLNISDISIKVQPSAEWAQIFDEAWRINRDYFYDPGMHGADWEAIKKKYEIFLPDLTCRNDLTRLIRWMCSELSVGHHHTGSGHGTQQRNTIGIGLLGADYAVENNRYKFDRIYGGLNWSREFRSPLTEPGIDIQEGEYILAVNGKDIKGHDNIFRFFENTANKITKITVGPNPDYKDSRTINIVPVNNEYSLRMRAWVEDNLNRVTEATDGKVAYVYVPDTGYHGLNSFIRYFFPQTDRKAIIVDARYNGGGMIADYILEILMRQYHAHWNFRHGKDLRTPSASIEGPKIMLINESSVSGGDFLPYAFKKSNIGTLIGTRTWGALVGTLGFPELMDGGYVTAPNIAIWTNEGFIVENVGIEPDIEVMQLPSELIKGIDPQLEKAIQTALEQLEKNPPKENIRPPYPIRVR